MCDCTSCKATDALWDKGFAAWPRGESKGPRKSAAEYAAHVAHGKAGISSGWTFKPGAAPTFPAWCQPAPALPYPSKLVRDFIASGYKRDAKPAAPKLQLVPKPTPTVTRDLADFVRRQLAA